MPRTVERTPLPAGTQLPPALLDKLRPLAAIAGVEQLLDVAAELDSSPHPLPHFAGLVRRLAIALGEVRATVRAKLGVLHASRLPYEPRYTITAAGMDALTDPEDDDAADTCPATLPLELVRPDRPVHPFSGVPLDVIEAASAVARAARDRHENQLPHSVRRALDAGDSSRGTYDEEAARMRAAGLELAPDTATGLPMWKAVPGGELWESLEQAKRTRGEG